jgi:hypothetical protein
MTIITTIVDIATAGTAFPIAPPVVYGTSYCVHPHSPSVERGPELHNAIGENASISSRAASGTKGMSEGIAALNGIRLVGLEANQGNLAQLR